jgi:hypothetical protein
MRMHVHFIQIDHSELDKRVCEELRGGRTTTTPVYDPENTSAKLSLKSSYMEKLLIF